MAPLVLVEDVPESTQTDPHPTPQHVQTTPQTNPQSVEADPQHESVEALERLIAEFHQLLIQRDLDVQRMIQRAEHDTSRTDRLITQSRMHLSATDGVIGT